VRPPDHIQNKAVNPSWRQLWREIMCSIKGHVFYVGPGGHYRGMPQSHCWRCGVKDQHGAHPSCAEWEAPLG
jgi:hypothetical protein